MATTRPPAPIPTSISEAARHYLSLPAIDPPSYPALDDIAGWLRLVEQRDQSIAQRFTDDGLPVTGERREVAGVGTYVLRADGVPDADSTPIYVDMHGGALIFAGGDLSRVWGSMTASTNGMITWSIDYRMPPLHPYPAALDDCLAVYRAVLELRDPADIFVGGASAGGNLAAALMVRARDEGLPMPAGLVLPTPHGRPHGVRRYVPDPRRSARWPEKPDGGQLAVRQWPRSDRSLPVTALRRPVRPPTHLPVLRDPRPVPIQHRPDAPQAACRRSRGRIFEAMPHGGFGGTTPEDIEVDAAILAFLDKHRRAS
jgi:epsilon-lactone hydrolase